MSAAFSVELRDVQFAYDKRAQMEFSGQFRRGGITAIMGASGSGKSTILALIAGFEVPQSGSIILEGNDVTKVPPSERQLSMVFQNNNLFAHLSAEKNVGLGIAPSLRLTASQKQEVDQALEAVGLNGYAKRLPGELSGGEQQRVALARVLVRNKPILLLDEAFASLNPGLRDDMLDLVAKLTREKQLSTLMVTHSPDDAQRIAQDLVFVDSGKIIQSGAVAEVLGQAARNPIIANYLGTV